MREEDVNLKLVTENLLSIHHVNHDDVFSLLERTKRRDTSHSDFYFQSCRCQSWGIENRSIKNESSVFDRGVGIRVIRGRQIGFAYSNDLSFDSLLHTARLAQSIASNQPKRKIPPLSPTRYTPLYPREDPFSSSEERKIELLHRIDRTARSFDKRVTEVRACLTNQYEEILVMADDGTLAADIRPMVHVSVLVQAEQDGRREQGTSGCGVRTMRNILDSSPESRTHVDNLVNRAVESALSNLRSIPAPTGAMPVVLGPGWPGVLFHEAVGHGLEADFNRTQTSIFSDKIGTRVASELCTVVDDNTLEHGPGSSSIDDEGVSGRFNVLVEHGVLKAYMQDKFNAGLMGAQSSGNGRRQSYAHLPLPRMTNTYVLPGASDPQDIILSTPYGIYASNFSGGQVDVTSGQFVFTTSEARLIENGKITTPVKDATLIGTGTEVMKRISMVGNDFRLDDGTGTCGKEGQMVPVSVGQPTLKIAKLTVGGTKRD